MTNLEFEAKFARYVRTERKITNVILEMILEAEDRRIHLERGFPSLFEWLVQGHGYSRGAAYRRIQAARLLREVPEVKEKVEAGELNLTNLAKAGDAIKAKEKVSGIKMSAEEKREVVKEVENKSSDQAQAALFAMMPEIVQAVSQEKKTVVGEDAIRFTFNMSKDAVEDFEWTKNFLSHVIPEGEMGLVIARVLKEYRQKNDPLLKKASLKKADREKAWKKNDAAQADAHEAAGEKPTHLSATDAKRVKTAVHRVVIQEAAGCCEYVDEVTGRRCSSPFQTETDHDVPRALGGGHERANLRLLCRAHNILMSGKKLGRNRAYAWREGKKGWRGARSFEETAPPWA